MGFWEITKFGFKLNKIRKEIGKMGDKQWVEKVEEIVIPIITVLLSILKLNRFLPASENLIRAIAKFIDAGMLQRLLDALEAFRDSPEARELWDAIKGFQTAVKSKDPMERSALPDVAAEKSA